MPWYFNQWQGHGSNCNKLWLTTSGKSWEKETVMLFGLCERDSAGSGMPSGA